MKASIFAKSVLANLLDNIGIPGATIKKRAGIRYPILMYHRVVHPDREVFPIQGGMYVEPETFEEHIRYLKRHFRVIPFAEMISQDSTEEKPRHGLPISILTFDDGWRDFYDFAYPILIRHQVPATVFLPTGYIGTENRFWSDRLAFLMTTGVFASERKAKRAGSRDALLNSIASFAGGNESRLESAIAALKELGEKEIEKVLMELKEMTGVGSLPPERVFLNWDEIREMKGSGLVSFGSHTHKHRILLHLEEEQIREELSLSREILLREGAADRSFITFSYPNGEWNDQIAQMVRKAGYHASVTTKNGWNEENSTPFELRRIAIHQDMTQSGEMFGCRVAGIL